MAETQIRFDDGAAYERMMGIRSQLAGNIFLDWLAPRSGLRWIDIGCGNGAFTELLVERCAPAEVQGVDPSEAQLAFAHTTRSARGKVQPQGGIVARLDVKSEVLIWPSTLPSSSMSTPDQAPDCTRILTLAFRGTRLSALQPPPPPLS